jgi:hypothetical protein
VVTSARLDVPSADAKARTMAILGLEGGLPVPAPSPRSLGRWLGVGIVGLVLLGGGVTLFSRSPRTVASEAAPTTSVVAPVAVAPAAPVEVPNPSQPAAEPVPATEGATPIVSERRREGADDLGPQLALIDGARALLAQGNAKDALTRLKEYEARYPGGALGPEATALRVEALLKSGDRTKGQALGEKLIAQHPNGPYTARIRSLLARTP